MELTKPQLKAIELIDHANNLLNMEHQTKDVIYPEAKTYAYDTAKQTYRYEVMKEIEKYNQYTKTFTK